jgi:hypothetical protein
VGTVLRSALALCLAVAGCAVTTTTPLRVVRDANDRGLPWAVGAVYDTLNGRVTITGDGAVVAESSFGVLDTSLQLSGTYNGYALAALCSRAHDGGAHFGSSSIQCQVSVGDGSVAGTVRRVQLGPDVDRESLASALDSSSLSLAYYDASTGQITVTIDGTAVAEGAFPPTATQVQLNGVHRNLPVTALCIKSSEIARDIVRCTVTEGEAGTAHAVSGTSGDISASTRPATEQPSLQSALDAVKEQPSGLLPTLQPAQARVQPGKQPVPAQATLRSCGGPQCVRIDPQTCQLASSPGTTWIIAGDYDTISNRLTLTVNGVPAVQGRFGFLDSELQMGNEFQGHTINASCTKSHGASLVSSALKCTVFVDQQRAVVLQKET